jgi:hypothetical protein
MKSSSEGKTQNVNKDAREDLTVQLTMEVLRQCDRPSHDLQETVYGNALVKPVSVKTSVHQILRNPGRWIRRKESVEWPPRSPDLTSSDFYLRGDLKNAVYARKPRTLLGLCREIEIACAAVPPATIREVYHFAACRQQCSGACVKLLKICELKVNNTIVG